MKKEFKLAKGWQIFIWIALPILMTIPIGLSTTYYLEEGFSLSYTLIILPISIGMAFFIILGLIDSVKGKYIITDDKLISIGIFKTKELRFDEIKGVTSNQNYLIFHPKTKEQKKIKVSMYIGKYNEFAIWTDQNFTILDLEKALKEEQEILNNLEIGRNINESTEKLERARKLTKMLNVISLVVAIATIFFPIYYKMQIVICAALPILGLLIIKNSKGLIKLDEKPKSSFPNLITTLLMPSVALAMRALFDFNILDFSNVFKFSIAIIILIIMLLFSTSELSFKLNKIKTYFAIILISAFGGVYSVGALIVINGIFGKNEPTGYGALVVDKRINTGKSTIYYLKLSKWEHQPKEKDVSVDKEIYDKKEIGDQVTLYYRIGLFEIPYYLVMNE